MTFVCRPGPLFVRFVWYSFTRDSSPGESLFRRWCHISEGAYDMTPTILFVDDEPVVLRVFRALFAEEPVEVITVSTAAQALDVLKSRTISVLVADYMMPDMNGIELLEEAKRLFPDCSRILLTGYADVDIAIEAINRGAVYRFMTKPWDARELKSTVMDAIGEYSLITSLHSADEAKLLSLAQMIELKDHYTMGHCEKVARYALAMAARLGFSGEDLKHVKYASWLHDCGKIGVPEAVLNYPGRLSEEMMTIVRKHSDWGADVARKAALPGPVVDMIRYHHEKFDGTGYPAGLAGEAIPLGARIIAIADVFDSLTAKRPYRDPFSRQDAVGILLEGKGSWFDPQLLDHFLGWLETVPE